MRHLPCLFFVLICSLSSAVAQPSWQWAEQHGGASTFVTTTRMAVDGAGNSYLTGYFSGTATFGTTTLTSAGNRDLFVAKVDSSGSLLWARSAGGVEDVFGRSISLDAAGNAYVTGSFAGTATFGSETVMTTTGGDVFLAKYDSSGVVQWVRSGGGGEQYRDESFAVTSDAAGNSYITGYFIGTATFGSLPSLTTAGTWDIFVVAYDSAGNEQWSASAGGATFGWYAEAGRGIAVDGAGNVYVAGSFIGSAQFGAISVTAAGSGGWPPPADVFLAKYDPAAGAWTWVVTGGGSEDDRATDLEIDAAGSLLVAGTFLGSATFGSTALTSSVATNHDYFLAKYDANGNAQWVIQAGGPSYYKGHGIGLDGAGNVYLTGTFGGTTTVGGATLTSNGYDNVYVAKFNPSGGSEWVVHSPGNYYHVAADVATDSLGNVYAAGWFRNSATFDQTVLSSSGTTDLFVARLGDCEGWEVACREDIITLADCPAVVPDVRNRVEITNACWPLSDYSITQNPPVGAPLSAGLHAVVVTVTGPDGQVRECDVMVSVECPPCEVSAVTLNTGFDHTVGTLYPIGSADAFWTVVSDPDSGTFEDRPATVITANQAWAPAQPNSHWISAYPTNANFLNGFYDLETEFCLLPDWREVVLDLCLRADDTAEVYLNGVLLGAAPDPSFNTANPFCITEGDQSLFQTGTNILRVRLINTNSFAMGLNLVGSITGQGLSLEDPACCQPGSSLSGQKFEDVNGNGVFDSGEPALAGWTIELSNGDTAVTDSNGYYYFMNLLPGSYTVNEVQQQGWLQTAPSSGGHFVTLGGSQSINELDFGNQKCLQIQCPNFEPIPCQGPDGTFIDIDVLATSGCSDDVTIECSVDLSGPFWPGTTLVECVATDGAGNTATCQFEITVVAEEPWDLECPPDVVIENCPAVVPDMTDYIGILNNCWPMSEFEITQDPPAGTPLNEGSHSVIVTVIGPDGEKRQCEIRVTVRCPPCEVEAVSLNTGFDHTTGGMYPTGVLDSFWTVVNDPDSTTTEPRPAAVINAHQAWEPALPNSQWISAYPAASNNLNGSYDLETTFCLLPDWSDVVLDLCLRADDWAEVYLNNVLIATTPNPSFNTTNPTCIIENDQTLFQTGTNTVRVRMINAMGVAMGVNLAGQVRGVGLSLEDPRCCQKGSAITGQKFNDLNGNGAWDQGEPVIPGWTVELSNGDTAVTDSNGYYYFMNLAPGAYALNEVQQSGWLQTAPAGGAHTVTLNAGQSVSGLDFGNFREANTPPKVECSEDIFIPCDSPSGTSVSVSAQLSDANGNPLSYVWEINGSAVQSGNIPAGGPPTTGSSTLTYSFPTGVHSVTIIVTDSAGAEASCEVTVTVSDRMPPVIRCHDGIITLSAGDDCVAILPDMQLGVWDNCTPDSDLVIIQNPPAGTFLSPGMHTVLVTVTDSAGNQASCKVEIRVADRTPPVVECPDLEPVEDCEGIIPDLIGQANISDNCDGLDELVVTQTPPPGTAVGPGSHQITITATDASGNTGSCTTAYVVSAPPLSVEAIELFNTGVDANGVTVADGAVDQHYELITSADPNFPGPDARVVNSTGYPMGSWILNDANSKWIAPRSDAGQSNASGVYVYETTFTLPAGMTAASINGRWLTDNSAELRLNGVPTGDTKPVNGFSLWTNFSITSGFVAGLNTLEFVVTAVPSSQGFDFPTGLRVELQGRVQFCEPHCVAPHIVQHPNNLVKPVGSTATFSVSAGGTSPLSYQWFFNGNAISGATSATLTIAPVTYADSGHYSVLVVNDCGERVSKRAVLRVRRKTGPIIGQWDFEPSNPLGATVGEDMRYLDSDSDGDGYAETSALTHFGSTDEFGLPGIDGRPVHVMRFSRVTREMGYLIRGEAPENQHTFIFDLFLPEGVSDTEVYVTWLTARALLQPNPANDTPADIYVIAQNGGDCNESQICVAPNRWNRVAVTVDLESDTPVMAWFLNGERVGQRTLSEANVAQWKHDLDADGMMQMLLFTDVFGSNDIGFVGSIQWQNTVLSDIEIAALGGPASNGIATASRYLLKPELILEREQSAGGAALILYWIGDGFSLQESSDMRTWTDSNLTPGVEIIGDDIVYEVTVPMPADRKRFYRVTED